MGNRSPRCRLSIKDRRVSVLLHSGVGRTRLLPKGPILLRQRHVRVERIDEGPRRTGRGGVAPRLLGPGGFEPTDLVSDSSGRNRESEDLGLVSDDDRASGTDAWRDANSF